MRKNFKKLIVLITLCLVQPIYGQVNTENSKSPMGINIEGVIAWQEEFIYTNLVHQALPWKPLGQLGWNDELAISNLDANGYLLANTAGELPVIWDKATPFSGDFVCTWEDGAGSNVSFHTYPGSGINITNQSGNRIEFTITDISFLFLRIENGANPVSNIRLVETKNENSNNVFYPQIYETWTKFKAIRFMDLLSTNNSQLVTVEDYTSINSLRMQYICPEYIAHLCNRLNADAWVCIPHQANDDLISHMANELNDHLNSNLKIFVEYSNEVWNGMFEQSNYAAEMALSNPEWAELFGQLRAGKWYARRSKQIFDIFESVLGSTDNLVRVISWQGGMGSWWHEHILYIDDIYLQTDAYAISYYFGYLMGNPQFAEGDMSLLCTDIDDVFAKIPTFLNELTTDITLDYEGLKNNEDFEHIELFAYEGGQHLVSYYYENQDERDRQNELFMAANRDPRMKDVYLELFDGWRELGGKLFMNFSGLGQFSQWGSWSQKEHSSQTREEAPKYDADLEWIDNNPVNWDDKSFTWDLTNNISQTNNFNNLEIISCYPNPFSEVLLCKLPDGNTKQAKITFNSLDGKEIHSESLNNSEGNNLFKIPTKNLPKGIYILNIITQNNVYSSRVIKQ